MDPRRLHRDSRFARLRNEFLGYENVVGVSVGTKFSNGVRQKGIQSVQFFVSRKVAESKLTRVLPRAIDLGLEAIESLPTDVIELRNLEVCCGAGSKLEFSGGSGTATILFGNANPGDTRRLFLTCAHVTGAVDASPLPATTVLGAHEGCFFQGRFLHRAIHDNQRLEFDVAIGELTAVDPRFVNLQVGGTSSVLTRFSSVDEILPETVTNCVVPSGATELTVASQTTEFRDVSIGGQLFTIANLVAATGDVERGDSGGIVHLGGSGVGMVVARADGGWAFFHPLGEAFAHLATIVPFPIACF